MKLARRASLITGASQGLGAAIAEAFVREGASVALCARSAEGLAAIEAQLTPLLAPGARLLTQTADVADTGQVDALVDAALDAFPNLDILVNNAGVYGPLGALENIDWQEWVDAIHINLMGTVYPCRALLPHLKAKGYGKIITISGGGATNPLPRISAYAASKAAAVRFCESLALEVAGHSIDVNAVAPGALATRLNQQLLEAGPQAVGDAFYARMQKLLAEGGTPPELGAKLCVYLASQASDGITGRLISAQWDPWENLHDFASDINGSDIYTIRRIVPKDRGKAWGDK